MINQTDFIRQVAKDTGFTIKDITSVFESFEKIIVEDINAGEDVRPLKGVTFKSEIRAARQGRNPHTGESISIPAKRTCKISTTGSFKAKIK